jgi:hypothetical protein
VAGHPAPPPPAPTADSRSLSRCSAALCFVIEAATCLSPAAEMCWQGEKWGTVNQDLMIVQRCGSCNYGGPSAFQLFNLTSVWQGQGDWWFASAGSGMAGQAAMGWAAMRAAYGGATFENSTSPRSARVCGNIGLNDVWSPLLLIAGGASEYGTVQNFTSQVEAAPFTAVKRSHVSFRWRGRSYGFTPGPSTWKGNWSLPTIDGTPVSSN